MAKYFLVPLLFVFICANTSAQTLQHDTIVVADAANNTKDVYSQIMKEQLHLFNGGDYIDYRPLKDEHPYYISEDWMIGSIQYDCEYYDKAELLYNIYTDQVIAEHYSSAMIQLVRDKIQSFFIDGHTFVMLQETTIPKGFYDRLCNGKTKVYAKRIKELEESISSNELQREFRLKSKYYICKDGYYYPVKSKKSVLSVLGDKKHELNQFIHQNHLRFRQNRENAIIKLTEFYNAN